MAENKGLTDSAGIVVIAVLWGIGYLMGNKSLATATFPTSTASVRYFMGVLLMGGVVVPVLAYFSPSHRAEIKETFGKHLIKSYLVEVIAVGAVYHIFGGITLTFALAIIPSGVAAVVYSLEPIVAGACLAAMGERGSFLSKEALLGSFICVVGVAMVVWPNIQNDLTNPNAGSSQVLGTFTAIFSTIAYGVGVAFSKRLADNRLPMKTSAIVTVAGQLIVGSLGSIFASLVFERSGSRFFEGMTGETYGWLVAIAIGPTCTCWIIFSALVRRVGAKASLYAFLVPPVSMVAGAWFNHEWDGLSGGMKTLQVFGLVVDVLGLALVLRKDIFVKDDPTPAAVAADAKVKYQPQADEEDTSEMATIVPPMHTVGDAGDAGDGN